MFYPIINLFIYVIVVCFFCFLFFCFVLFFVFFVLFLFFFTFWYFKIVNQRFAEALISIFVRLSETTWDNISNWPAVEKLPLPLEKYEKDPSKYCLTYPKLFVLEVKWENGNINFAEWANIAKFSKLDDIMTPLRLLKLFFEDVLVNLTLCYINLYSDREKADISFEISNKKIFLFLTILLLLLLRGNPWYFCAEKVWFNAL